jgi:SAM-dependent methyltransferase
MAVIGSERPGIRSEYAIIGLLACSMLTHEILLTRICALRLHFHFAFLVISNCLLGLGASGALLVIAQERLRSARREWLATFSIAYTVSLVAAFAFLRSWPLPADLLLSRPSDLLSLTAFNLVGAVPFLFGGLAVGLLLTFDVERVNRLYAVDLLGASLGCIACPLLLPHVGAGGVFVVTVMLGGLASAVAYYARNRSRAVAGCVALWALGLYVLPSVDGWLPIPSKGEVDAARVVERARDLGPPYSVWTSNSRIDLVRIPEGTPAHVFMRGRLDRQLRSDPQWAAISQDATAGTIVVNYSEQPWALSLLEGSMYSTAFRLRSGGDALVIGLGGGNDVWAAKAAGMRSVKAVELNWPIVDIHRRVMRRYSRGLVDDPRIRFVVDEGRSALMRERGRFDVVQMSGIDTWTALASGAYVLAENYLYTRQAIEAMYRLLKPGGVLQIARFAATMEALRLVSNIEAALDALGVQGAERSLCVLATDDMMMAVQVKKGAFTDAEKARTLSFAEEHGIDVLYLPDHAAAGPIADLIRAPDRAAAIARFPLNIEPTDDDRPYFFNYTRWQSPLSSLALLDVIPAVSQGNPLFLLSQLGLSVLMSGLFVVAPIAWRRAKHDVDGSVSSWRAARYLAYFSGLGLGFIAIEIAVMQKLTLLLGQPVYSLTVTLLSLLLFTGVGSVWLGARFPERSRVVWVVPCALVLYLVPFATWSEALVTMAIGLSLPVRIGLAIAMLAPLGVLLGMPFAHGLRVLSRERPELVPWAWAVNGSLSVVGSVATVVVSMTFGFSAVLYLAALLYLGAFAALFASRPA